MAGSTTESIFFTLNLVDLGNSTTCTSTPTITDVNRKIIPDVIEYAIGDRKEVQTLDSNYVQYSPPTDDPCNIRVLVVNSDDSLLDPILFSYQAHTK